MASRGISAEIVAPDQTGSLHEPGRHDLAIVLGCDESAYDDSLPWVAEEFDYVRRAIESEVPVLGICFGAQMLARALGSEVHEADAPEVGWMAMTRARAAAWMPPGPWLTWHQDTFDWPPRATPLAWTDAAPQAFSQGPHLGIQFHPEATAQMIEQWLEVDRRALALKDIDPQALLAETREQDRRAGRAATVLFERYFDRLLRLPPRRRAEK